MSITLLYQTALPSVQNRTFELSADVGNWTDEGGHTLSRTTTAAQVRTGIASGKIVSDGNAGNYGTNYISLTATYMPLVTLAYTYKVRLYAKSSAGTPNLTIANAGNNTGTATALNSTTWTKCEFDFTAAAGDVSTHLIRIWIPASTEVYFDDVQFLRYETYTGVLAMRGVDDFDGIDIYPDEGLTRLLNGSYYQLPSKVFNRSMQISLNAVLSKPQRVFLAEFAINNLYQALIYSSEEIEVLIPDRKQLQSIWMNDLSLTRAYNLDLIEKNSRSANPALWS
jgi:hypothetical protein